MNGLGELDKLENELEDEIRYENRSPAKTFIGRMRREGYHKLHSKMVLFIIVFLNVIDCLLVMAELTLDFHHVSQLLSVKDNMLQSFLDHMSDKYRPLFDHLKSKVEESHHILQDVLDANIAFRDEGTHDVDVVSGCASFLNKTAEASGQSLVQFLNWTRTNLTESPNSCFSTHESNRTYQLTSTGKVVESLTAVGHKLHYISIAILSVLVVALFLKIFCSGKRFVKSRMQVFDGIIIIISFVLDLVFIEGLTNMDLDEFVMIMTFLLPWRILRVLNSLIVAVLDKQRLNLKIIYTQKKKISRTLAEVNNKLEVMQRHVEVLQSLCASRGIGEYEVKRALGGDNGSAKNGSSGGLASMMALGKLAFQAADAFAPMTNGYKKGENSTSEPALNTGDITTIDSTSVSDPSNENNNVTQKLQNGHVVPDMDVDMDYSEPYIDISPSTEISVDTDLEAVTVHLNGSGPRKDHKETSLNHDMKTSSSAPDLTDIQSYINGNEIISKL
ncbi:unnamed protein product [Lymnaea stagnalis]|uniref:Voltage-gated hydrogen channel 1 n=1 Tax=Lymnaea stagnalis TaxID=6523 RepID=A0AAV2GZW4_LYMST